MDNMMMKHINMIQRIDQLIHMQATGTPEQLAKRLSISKTKVHRLINIMKDLNAPIVYDFALQSYIYQNEVGFKFGFYTGAGGMRA